ncbi:MAG: hypothetical protein ACLFU9_03230 [Candidatus Bathyarchaeia archaeon]
MPYCWLHTADLSNDGYTDPDNNDYTFSGFSGKAPGLTYNKDEFYGTKAYYFTGYFYQYVMLNDKSINDALDYAAQNTWGVSFADCIFYTGYTVYGYDGKMVIYGDGNLEIGSATSTPSLPPPPPPPPSGGGGCPILFVWNGSDYVKEGLLDIHNPEGVDVVYDHTLVALPERVDGAYLFRLVEHPQTISHIDQVKLYALFEDGSMVELPLIGAWHSEDGNVLPMLLFSDDWKVDLVGAEK